MDSGSCTRSSISIVISVLEAEARNDPRTPGMLPTAYRMTSRIILSHLGTILRHWPSSEAAEAVWLWTLGLDQKFAKTGAKLLNSS